jgi:hypothetical protein
MSGGRAAATVGVAGIGLAELADHERTTLAPWLAWLDAGDVTAPVPAAAQALDAGSAWHDVQAALAARMRGWFGATGGLPDVPLSRVACAHALLHRLGLRDALVVETLATWARLPAVIAEANHARAGGIRAYPARLPDYQYVDEQGASP